MIGIGIGNTNDPFSSLLGQTHLFLLLLGMKGASFSVATRIIYFLFRIIGS
jgi:hypothetical protein